MPSDEKYYLTCVNSEDFEILQYDVNFKKWRWCLEDDDIPYESEVTHWVEKIKGPNERRM